MSGVGCSLLSLDDLTDGQGNAPDAALQDADADVDAAPEADAASADASEEDAAIEPDAEIDAANAKPTYPEEVLADQPIGYWRFEDVPGSTIAKATVGGINAKLAGDVAFDAEGAVGQGLHFTSGELQLGDNFDILGTMPFAAEFWAKPVVTAAYENVLYKRSSSNGGGGEHFNGYAVFFYNDKSDGGYGPFLQSEVNWSTDNRQCQTKYPANGYLHVVVTYDLANGIALYVNGASSGNCYNGNGGGPIDTTAALSIGQNFTGWLDEVALYDHTLTEERVLAHLAAGKP